MSHSELTIPSHDATHGIRRAWFVWLISLVSAFAFVAAPILHAKTHTSAFTENLNVADGLLASTVNPMPEGLLVGQRDYQPAEGSGDAPDTSHYKAWLSIPFASRTFVEEILQIPHRFSVANVTLTFTTHPALKTSNTFKSGATGTQTFNVYGLNDPATLINTSTNGGDTWNSIPGNLPASPTGTDAGKMTLLATFAIDAATITPGQQITLNDARLTDHVNAALTRYFRADKTRNTLPTAIVLAITPAGTANTTPLFFEREPVLAYSLHSPPPVGTAAITPQTSSNGVATVPPPSPTLSVDQSDSLPARNTVSTGAAIVAATGDASPSFTAATTSASASLPASMPAQSAAFSSISSTPDQTAILPLLTLTGNSAPDYGPHHAMPVAINVGNGDTQKTTTGLIPEGILVGKRSYEPPAADPDNEINASDNSTYKSWLSLPFEDATFVENQLGIPYRRTVSSVALNLTTHANLHAINTPPLPSSGEITYNVHGLLNHAYSLNPATDTWTTIEGNNVSSPVSLNTAKTVLLGSITFDAATLQPGQHIRFTNEALTEFANTALDYYFYTHKDHNTVPSGITLILTPAAAATPAILFEREPVLSWEMRYFNGQVGSGSENDVFDPAYDRPPIPGGSAEFVGWATGIAELNRGLIQITDEEIVYPPNSATGSNRVTFGRAEDALGPPSAANPNNPYEVVSLGDGGSITLTFDKPITNGEGWDFAVFENGFVDYTNFSATESMAWLELAHVEVSSDGINFIRFPSISLTRPYNGKNYSGGTGFATTPASTIHNLAGKYILGYGTPFDLDDLKSNSKTQGADPVVNLNRITHVRVVDVVGINGDSVVTSEIVDYDRVTGDPIIESVYARDVPGLLEQYASYDSEGNIITDPWPTPFWQGGFDLDAVGVRHQLHESTTWSAWKTEQFTPGQLADESISGPLADPDQDGISNLIEYALAGGPLTQSLGVLPTSALSEDGRLTLTFFRQRDDIIYTVQGSDDLQTWTTIIANPGEVAQRVTVTDTASVGASPRFLRLHVKVRNGTDEAHTVPEGLLTTTIAGGSTAAFSIPLDRAPVARGPITGVGPASITVASAGAWADPEIDDGTTGENALETPTLENPIVRRYTPYALRFLTGNLSGATFFIDTVSGNTVNLVTYGVDLTTMVQVGDIYTIIPLHTLGTLFGEDEVSFQTAATVGAADMIQIWTGETWLGFYHNGTNWRQVGVAGGKNNAVIPPDFGLLINRRSSQTIALLGIGRIRDVSIKHYTKSPGMIFSAGHNPTKTTLAATGFRTNSDWASASTISSADVVQIWDGATWLGFYHNGTSWRQVGAPGSKNGYVLPPGQPLFVTRKGAPSLNAAFIEHPLNFIP